MTVLKSIVLCLALLNAGYFLWTHGLARSPEAAPATSPPRVLKLVSEAPEAARAVAAETSGIVGSNSGGVPDSSNDGNPPGLLGSSKRCVTVGPFRDVAEAAHAASTLRADGYDPRQRVVDGDVWSGVWVYLPVSSGPSVNELLAKLKTAGIDDALEMPGPNEGSVISLGLFTEQKRAQARVAQAQALGLKPGVADRKRTGSVYWIDVELKATDGVPNSADLQGEAGHISRLETKACPVPGLP